MAKVEVPYTGLSVLLVSPRMFKRSAAVWGTGAASATAWRAVLLPPSSVWALAPTNQGMGHHIDTGTQSKQSKNTCTLQKSKYK